MYICNGIINETYMIDVDKHPDLITNPNTLENVYVYDRVNGKVDECKVKYIDRCLFAIFEYNGKDRHYDLRNAVIFPLDTSFSPVNFDYLVSFDRKSLLWLRDSDRHCLNSLRSGECHISARKL